MLIYLSAEVCLPQKTRPIRAGYRPTLKVGGEKTFCNFEEISPDPLAPGVKGKAKIRVLWSDRNANPLVPESVFGLFEGESEVGTGAVISIDSVEE